MTVVDLELIVHPECLKKITDELSLKNVIAGLLL